MSLCYRPLQTIRFTTNPEPFPGLCGGKSLAEGERGTIAEEDVGKEVKKIQSSRCLRQLEMLCKFGLIQRGVY